MSESIGRVVVEVGADASGFRDEVSGSLGDAARAAEGPAQSLGNRFTGIVGKVLKGGLLTVGATAGGLLGVAMTKGMGRLGAIEQAEAKLGALGNSTKEVAKIMDNAMASVSGTAFGLGDAATVAAATVAAGVKPGKELEKVLKTVANSAAIAGMDMGDMGSIFNKVAATGKVSGDVIGQLSDAGVPALQFLASELGVTSEKVADMASKGQVDFKTFEKAMSKGVGPAAEAMGKTVEGGVANTKAALGRIGAKAVAPIFEALPGVLEKAIAGLDSLAPAAERVGDRVGAGISRGVEIAKGLDWSGIGASVGTATSAIQGELDKIDWGKIGTRGAAAFDSIKVALADIDMGWLPPAIDKVWAAFQPLVGLTFEGLMQAFESIGPIITGLTWTVEALITALSNPIVQASLAGIGTTVGVLAGMWLLLNAQIAIAIIRMSAVSVAATAWAAITKTVAAGQAILNAVMYANPIGLIIALIAGLVVGLVVAYKKSETFRNVVDGAFSKVKAAAKSVADFFTQKIPAAFDKVKESASKSLDWVKSTWGTIKTFLMAPISAAVSGVSSSWDKITAGVKSMFGKVKTTFNNVVDFVKGIPAKILGALGDLSTMLKDSGTALLDGFLAGIQAGFDKVTGAVQGGLKKVRGFFPFSPAKEGPFSGRGYTTYAGRALMDGLAIGITQGAGVAEKAMAGATEKVAAAQNSGGKKKKKGKNKGTPLVALLLGDGPTPLAGVDKFFQKVSDRIDLFRKKKRISIANTKSLRKDVTATEKAIGKIVKAYSKATEDLKSMQEARSSMVASVADSIKGQMSLSDYLSKALEQPSTNEFGFSTGGGGGVSAAGIGNYVKGMAAKAQAFATLLGSLIKKGIPKGLVTEVSGMGFADGTEVGKALLAMTNTQVGSLRADYSSFATEATRAGDLLAAEYFDVGIRAQEGIIKGLLKPDTIKKAAKRLAEGLTKALRKSLGIKSPSVKMEKEIGIYTGEGVGVGAIKGMEGMTREVGRAVSDMVAVPALAPLDGTVPGGPLSRAVAAPVAALGTSVGSVFSDADIERLAAAVSARKMDLTVEVGATNRTKARWYLDGQVAAEELK